MNLLENSCPLLVEEIISTNGGQSSYLQEHNDWPGNREREVYRFACNQQGVGITALARKPR
jgi:hypothetical protein